MVLASAEPPSLHLLRDLSLDEAAGARISPASATLLLSLPCSILFLAFVADLFFNFPLGHGGSACVLCFFI